MKSVKKYQLKSWVKKTLLGLLIIGTMPFVYIELV